MCQENQDGKLADAKKVFKKEIEQLYKEKKFTDGVDIAMFGRMTTSDVFENCDAAIQVAHAISTHPVKNEDDFFTAVDDLPDRSKDDMGSGHMDEKQFNTGIFYKYATVDYEHLKKNLADDSELTQKAIVEFLEAFMMAQPTGSQNSMAAHQHPFTILITIGEGANSNLTNAFAQLQQKGSNGGELFKNTTHALLNEFTQEQQFFGKRKAVDHALVSTRCDASEVIGDKDLLQQCEDIDDLLKSVSKAISGEEE